MFLNSAKISLQLPIVLLLSASGVYGDIIPIFIGGTPSANVQGGGNIVSIFEAAAAVWNSAIEDPYSVTLFYGWSAVGTGTHTLGTQGGVPNRETSGTILFGNNNDPAFPWFMDPTPTVNEEYLTYSEYSQDLGGGLVNVGRVFSNGVGSAGGNNLDLFTTALHEIMHGLGTSNANYSFIAESADGDIDITAPLPFAGTLLPLAFNNFGVTSHLDPGVFNYALSTRFAPGERVLPSAVDILADAQLSGFRQVNLNPVPEPSGALLLGSVLVALAIARLLGARLPIAGK